MFKSRSLLGKKRREVLDEHHRTERVCAEGEEGIVVVDLGGRFFGEEEAGNAECEAQICVFLGV